MGLCVCIYIYIYIYIRLHVNACSVFSPVGFSKEKCIYQCFGGERLCVCNILYSMICQHVVGWHKITDNFVSHFVMMLLMAHSVTWSVCAGNIRVL